MTADFIWGAKAIADFLREECGVASATSKMVYHWADRSVIPIATLNRKLVISRGAVFAHFNSAINAAVERCQTVTGSEIVEPISPPSPTQSEAAPNPHGGARGPRHRIR
jgi:hypothetical protein